MTHLATVPVSASEVCCCSGFPTATTSSPVWVGEKKSEGSILNFFCTNQCFPSSAHLEVPFRGESPSADGAGEGLFARVSPLVNLEGACRREVLATRSADMLLRSPARGRHQQRPRGRQHMGANKMGRADGTIARNFHFYKTWRRSDKSRVDAVSTYRIISKGEQRTHWYLECDEAD